MTKSAPKIIIVMPTYNEAENLPLMAAELFALGIEGLELLVSDDNSPDGTWRLAEELGPQYGGRVHVLRRMHNRGFGPAYVDGMKKALSMGADYVMQMDADFSHQPRYIPQMIAAGAGADLVIGSRYAPGGGVDESWGPWRKFLSWWANRVYLPTILGLSVRDATGGFRLWRRDAITALDLDRVNSSGYVFLVELAYIAHRLGLRIAEVPIYFPDRVHGESKMDLSIGMEAALRVWQIRFRHQHLTAADRRVSDYA